jgi:glutamyl-tRNA synthetase
MHSESATAGIYRGRLAPSPTGYLHLGHARTFWIAQERAQNQNGILVLRNEDLDRSRTKPEFVATMIEDLRWFGFQWQEGPDCGGLYGPYSQSERLELYRAALEKLKSAGLVYPCACSRQDVLRALQAPHAGEDDPIYPGTCRPGDNRTSGTDNLKAIRVNWRFRVPDGKVVSFNDVRYGPQSFVAGRDFGDFVIWRHDDLPSYQLAVVVDDSAMAITEVVRGEDLLKSTARQLVIYEALGLTPPIFYHCPLMIDDTGARLAKRHDALSLRNLRKKGIQPDEIRTQWKEC